MGNVNTVGPNEAMVVSGGCCGSGSKKYIIGGWTWAWWAVSDVQKITLEVMTLNPKCENVETSMGVPLTVTGVAQVKVMTEEGLLATACEQFLGRSTNEIRQVVLQTLEGHLRAILGTLTVEAIFQDRDQFAQLVREVASPDVGRMGLEIESFTIKDVFDRVDYLDSLGISQTAVVKRDADIGVAEANRDAGIREAECEKVMMDTKYDADTKIADSSRKFEMHQAGYEVEVNTKKAEAELAYELEAAKVKQLIRSEEIEIDVVERRKLIDIEEKEIERKERELIATIKRPAEAESYKVETIALGERTKTVLAARGEAEKIKKVGHAEAISIEAIGKAEAERMRMKAAAYKQYGDAAKMSLVLESLPKATHRLLNTQLTESDTIPQIKEQRFKRRTIAAEIAAPLAKTDEIVLLGDDRTTTELSKLLGSLPVAVQALTGTDLTKMMSKIPGAR